MHSRETFNAALDLSEQIASRYFAPHNALSDRSEPFFDGTRVHVIPEVAAAIAAFSEAGLIGAVMNESLGGIQLPHVIHSACFSWFQAANVSTSAYPMLTMAGASLLASYGSPDQVNRYLKPMLDGRFSATMCLSEPQAGSSVGDITTSALSVGNGTYRISGNKMWISGGDHDLTENIIHLVLARVPGAPAGVKGLSLFIVPKYLVRPDKSLGERNDVEIAGLNHKMGYRGAVNAVLNFGEGKFMTGGSAGAVGYLVGAENEGMRYMFHMMNAARIGVGAGATALGYTAYLHALDYARERTQGRLPGQKSPSAPQVPIIRHPDVRRMLLASKAYVEGGLALTLYAAFLQDEHETAATEDSRTRASLLLDLLTPIVKSWPSQWCLAANDYAIQIYGGYGYSRDYPVEQFYRDNRLNQIHEGTLGIQSLDLLSRKVRAEDGTGLRLLMDEIRSTISRANEYWIEHAACLETACDRIIEVTDKIWSEPNPDYSLANASLYMEALGHVVVGWIWLKQALAAENKTGNFYDGKRAAARFFFKYELPRIRLSLDILERLDTSLVDLDDGCL